MIVILLPAFGDLDPHAGEVKVVCPRHPVEVAGLKGFDMEASDRAEASTTAMAEFDVSTEASSEPKTIDFFANTFANTGIPR